MAKSKIDYRHIFIEALLIVFTVLLALGLSEWRSSIKEDQTREAVLNNILKELQANKNDLDRKMDYHLAMSQKLGRYLSNDSLWNSLTYNSGMEAMIQILERGIWNPILQNSAWRSAELSGVVNTFDYETTYILSGVYRVQEEGPDSSWKKIAGLFADPTSYDAGSARRLALMLNLGFAELHSQEKSLTKSYDKAINHLSKE
ncbi:MAG: hypothetical protein ABJG47_07180 [Ekhidna sp.]